MIINNEFIGKETQVVNATNQALVGISGKVVDETRNSFMIDSKLVLKNQVTLRFGNILVEGKRLVGRPEDRIKVKQ